MVIFVFKTNLENSKHIQVISKMLNDHPKVLKWSVDLDDWERVLRIEVKDDCTEQEIVECIHALGFVCKGLDN